MAKRRKPEYTCTVQYTEGCEQRLADALVDIYYKRLRGIGGQDQEKEKKCETETV